MQNSPDTIILISGYFPLVLTLVGVYVLSRAISEAGYLYSWSSYLPLGIRTRWIRHRHPGFAEKWPVICEILREHFPYFKLLTAREQQDFLNRLTDIRSRHAIEAREGQHISLQTETMIFASMAQLSFGYKDYRYSGLKKIIVYPDVFHSDRLNADVNGLTVGSGFVFISWKAFEEGYEHYRNKRNLGLHEFAHALLIFKADAREIPDELDKIRLFRRDLTEQYEQSHVEDPMFRDYGLQNDDEFWAVAAEVFFEQPLELRALHPDIYRFMQRMLKQDMAKRLEKYLNGRETLSQELFT